MAAKPVPIKASTQEFLDILDIVDDLVVMTDGAVALVMSTTALNFGLLSEREQEATILAYAALINSLSFPIQVMIRSQRKDISGYLRRLEEAEAQQKNKLLVKMMSDYRRFVAQTVKENDVLEKRFYVVIPFSALELGVSTSVLSGLKPGKKELPYSKEYILQKAKINLYPKRDHLMRQFNRLGLKTRQLNTQDLIQLFFNIYNPDSAAKLAASQEYVPPLVEGDPRYEKILTGQMSNQVQSANSNGQNGSPVNSSSTSMGEESRIRNQEARMGKGENN